MRILGMFSLGSGVLLDYQKGNKHQSELALLYKLLDHFKPRDLVIADRGFCNFVLMAVRLLRGVGSLFRLHQSRQVDGRKGKRLGKHDRFFTWTRPPKKPRYLANSIKTSMGMEILRCQSPKMVHKELEMFLIAYNLIRALMTEASAIYEVCLDRIRIKGTVDATRQFSMAIAQARSKKKQRQLVNELVAVLARDHVPERPGRREPRAVKRRPKPFPLLTHHRRRFKEIRHRNRYWKNNPRNARS